MKAEIVATGTELLLGQITDTNTPFVADQLASLGIDVYHTCCVGDNYGRMLSVLEHAWDRSDLVVTTGGLGPTKGDITRDAIAGLMGETPHVDPDLQHSIEVFFTQRGLSMSPNNLKQATLIPSAQAMPNPHGTAPGWWVERDGRTIVALPGPPRELQPMWQAYVLPRLEQRSGAIIMSRMIKTIGVSESLIDELVSGLTSCPSPALAMYAKKDGIYLRITAKAAQCEEARRMIAQRESDLREKLGEYIWGSDEDTLESAVSALLREKGLSLAVAETAFSGGVLTQLMADRAGNEGHFKGGIVSMTGKGEDADGALEMASGVRARFGADVGVAITGRFDTVGGIHIGRAAIAIDGERGIHAASSFSGVYPFARVRAAYSALFELRRALQAL